MRYYEADDVFEAYIAKVPSTDRRLPVLLVGHAWDGPNSHFRAMADHFATLGFLAIAIDVYGVGVRGAIDGDNSALMNPLLADRARLRRRLIAALQAAQRHPNAMADRVAMIGHCFGGLCALDLARAAPDGLVGVVAVHAPLVPPDLSQSNIDARVLVLHGWEDPTAKPQDVLALAREMTDAKADWELNAYGNAHHAFTFVGANIPQLGIKYDAKAHRRSDAAIARFLEEIRSA